MKEQEMSQTASESRATEHPATEAILDPNARLPGRNWEGYSLDTLAELLDP